MIGAPLTTFVEQRPFEAFSLILTNGREIHVPHAEFITTGNAVQNVYVIIPTGQLEIIDAAHIVSIRTFRASELPTF